MVQIKITSAIVLAAMMASSSAAPAGLNEHKLVARSPAPPAPQVVVDVFNKAPGKAKREPEPHGRVDSVVNLAKAGSDVYHSFKGKREPGPPPAPQVVVDVFNKGGKAKRAAPAPQVVVDVFNNKPKAKREPEPRVQFEVTLGKREPEPGIGSLFKSILGKREPEPGVGSFFKNILGGKRRELEVEERDMSEFEKRDLFNEDEIEM